MEIFVCADLTLNKWKTTSQLLSLVEKLFNSYKNQTSTDYLWYESFPDGPYT